MTDYFENYPGLAFERRDNGVLLMTLNRPDKLNATDGPLHLGLSRVWDDIDADPDTRVVVVTGAGDAFSAGGDLEWISGWPATTRSSGASCRRPVTSSTR
ncbi:MAG: enoyl-CoA hydratase-related protein [Acidimicrobiales bacterium]